jgi:hypothetical protein
MMQYNQRFDGPANPIYVSIIVIDGQDARFGDPFSVRAGPRER